MERIKDQGLAEHSSMSNTTNINIFNEPVANTQIQQNTHNSQQIQNYSYDEETKTRIERLLVTIRENLGQFGLTDEEVGSLRQQAGIVESEISKEVTNCSVINKSLSFIRNILERVPEHVVSHYVALGLAYEIGRLIKL